MAERGARAGRILSVNVGRAAVIRDGGSPTGIDKRPVAGPVTLAAPGPRGRGSGVAGDDVCDGRHHGGDDQAVYAYAREDLDDWAAELGRPLAGGVFGENLTTEGLDVSGARIGERWRIGDDVLLEVSVPRIPCGVFRSWMGERNWVSRFNARGAPGAYLRVIVPGPIAPGDTVVVESRPDHDVDVARVSAALTVRPELLASLLPASALPVAVLDQAREAAAGGEAAP